MLRINFKYGAATAAAGIVSSAFLAWSISHFTWATGIVMPFEDRMFFTAPMVWMFWRLDLIWLIVSTAAAGLRKKMINSHPVSAFIRDQGVPVAAVMVLSPLLHFVMAGEAGFVWGVWVSFAVALLAGQFTALLNNLYNIDYHRAPSAE